MTKFFFLYIIDSTFILFSKMVPHTFYTIYHNSTKISHVKMCSSFYSISKFGTYCLEGPPAVRRGLQSQAPYPWRLPRWHILCGIWGKWGAGRLSYFFARHLHLASAGFTSVSISGGVPSNSHVWILSAGRQCRSTAAT